jgi:hypothetical protein
MDRALVLTLAVVATALLVVVCLLLVVVAGRRRLARDLAESRRQIEELAARVDALRPPPSAPPAVRPETEYLITTVGEAPSTTAVEAPVEPLSAQQFASIAVGESLVRIVSFGYGVRRALSAENRNRIRFEMRREVRRSRKQRRRDLKRARHHLRTADLASSIEDAEDAA